MSKFLAPIHFKQYEKIKNQDRLVDEILKLNEEELWVSDLRTSVDQEFGSLSEKPLDEIIDETNIHGWLSDRIDLVENRLAFVVSNILKIDSGRKPIILDRMRELGAGWEIKPSMTILEVYQLIGEIFLDGMPCDRIKQVTENSEDRISWVRTSDIHSRYWTYDLDGKIYFEIRDSFIEGLVGRGDIQYEKLDNKTYSLKKIL